MIATTRLFVRSALLFLVGAALLHLLFLSGISQVGAAAIHLMIFGWITAMILAINYHTLPVFSGRAFPYPHLIGIHWGAFTVGVVVATAGFLGRWSGWIAGGLVLQLLAALLLAVNTWLLGMRGSRDGPHLPLPFPEQAEIDRLGTQATMGAGLCLPLAVLFLLLEQQGWLSGEWLLAAEHLMTLGWIMLMIMGMAYHVLPRFVGGPTPRGVRGVMWVRAQLRFHWLTLGLMIPALAWNWERLFALGAVCMTVSLTLFAWTVWPTFVVLRLTPRRSSANNMDRAQ